MARIVDNLEVVQCFREGELGCNGCATGSGATGSSRVPFAQGSCPAPARHSVTSASVEPAPINPMRQILPGERTEPRSDLDVESLQQASPNGGFFDARPARARR